MATSSSPGPPTISRTSTCSWPAPRSRLWCPSRRSSRVTWSRPSRSGRSSSGSRSTSSSRHRVERDQGRFLPSTTRTENGSRRTAMLSAPTSPSSERRMPDDRLVEPLSMDELQLSELRDERVRETVARCWNGSAFYRGKLEAAGAEPGDIRTVADLEKLPVLLGKDDERELQEASRSELGHPFGEHLCAPIDDVVGVASTSGTTGTPTFYAFTERDVAT